MIPPRFQPALQFVRPRKTKYARFARSEISSRCAWLACSTTTRRATIVTLSMYVRSLPRARCLTLALAPNGAGPGSLSDLRKSLSAALSLPARTTDALRRSNVLMQSNRCRLFERSRARGSGINVSRSRGKLICNLVASLLDLDFPLRPARREGEGRVR